MVRVGAGFAYYLNRLVHRKCLFLDKNTNQLRDHHGRMCIINLNHRMLIELMKIVFLLLHLLQNQMCRIGYHEVLLINAKKVTRFIRIIRVKEQCQVLLNRFLVKINALFHNTLINGFHIKKMQLIHSILIADHIDIIHA